MVKLVKQTKNGPGRPRLPGEQEVRLSLRIKLDADLLLAQFVAELEATHNRSALIRRIIRQYYAGGHESEPPEFAVSPGQMADLGDDLEIMLSDFDLTL